MGEITRLEIGSFTVIFWLSGKAVSRFHVLCGYSFIQGQMGFCVVFILCIITPFLAQATFFMSISCQAGFVYDSMWMQLEEAESCRWKTSREN